MVLKIKAGSWFENCSLEVDSSGVTYVKTAFAGGRRHFAFKDIECILLSPDNVLSFQAGREVFSIRVTPAKDKHKRVMDALLAQVQKASGAAEAPSFPPV